MSPRKVCPHCAASNEPSRQTCVQCSADISADLAGPGDRPGQPGEQLAPPPAETVTLTSPDGRVIAVRDGDVVGRTAVGKEVLDIHEEISRRHAQFVRTEGVWSIIDLGSSNGTFVDGERLSPRKRVALKNGQQVMFSPVFQAVVRIAEEAKEEGAVPAGQEGDSCDSGDRRTLVILFADLKGSVTFFQEKGTLVARKWILNLYRMLTSIVAARQGMHLKNIGDAILAVFDDSKEAVRAALDMQADLRRHNSATEEQDHYYLRIGLNRGTVLFENHDVFGNAVNIASRVQALAPPEHIYITECLYEAVRDAADIECRFIGNQQLKGVKDRTGIYEVLPGGAGPVGELKNNDVRTGDIL